MSQPTDEHLNAGLRTVLRDRYGLAPERLTPLVGYRDHNFQLDAANHRFVVKLVHPDEPEADVDLQTQALLYLQAADPSLPVPRVVTTLDGAATFQAEIDGVTRQVRLLTWLDGTPMAEAAPHPPKVLHGMGTLLGRLARAFEGFAHPAESRAFNWDLARTTDLRDVLPRLENDRRPTVERILDRFDARVAPLLPHLPHSVVHNDANDHNILVDETGAVSGLLDFGDLVQTATVCELAIAMAYAMLDQDDPIQAGVAVAAGYRQAHALDVAERELLPDLVRGRLAMTVTNAAVRADEVADNPYLGISAAPAWRLLDQLDSESCKAMRRALRDACPPRSSTAQDRLLTSRRDRIGRSMSISYRAPLTIVRGAGPYLFDEDGRAYLDVVNNVCHVGHAHPRVVAAIHSQAQVLNTNTRYLHPNLVRYAERLVATLPDPLSVCYFVCTGSEANELAIRLAEAHTARRPTIVVDGAYHGHTRELIERSPYKFAGPGGAGRADHVHVAPMPDAYRGPHKRSDPDAGRKYGDAVGTLAEQAARDNAPIGSFFCESILGCGGQVVLPPGYLETAFAHVRRAGGVCIVDEVQVGFGRAGTSFWAFEDQGVVPDIVTMGKPIGNGHPLAAVITTPAIAASFTNGMEYFNTFGGNPVSCAAGLAVLDVIEDEGLQQNARIVGAHLLEGLRAIAPRHSLVGDVRGLGLFIGVELVRNHETLEPAAEEASEIVERMKDRGILLSTDGPLHNVLKMKPPIVFTRRHADQVIAHLDTVLGEVSE